MPDHSIYLLVDGDDIGRPLELYLLDDDVDAAETYSRKVSEARIGLERELLATLGGRLIFSGGDELLVEIDSLQLDVLTLQRACVNFTNMCGERVSVGIGSTAALAASSLRRAKLLGKGRIVNGREVMPSGTSGTGLHICNGDNS